MKLKKPNKKLSSEGEEDDKLRDLPEPILHYILSFLDLKEAVRTSVLSTRWRYLWASLPFLNFEFPSDENKVKAYKEFVDQVLFLRDASSNIQSFHLDCHSVEEYDRDLTSRHLNTWILTALRRKLQEFYLNLTVVEEGFRLPRYLFSCESLTKLELKKAWDSVLPLRLNIPDSMSLPRLETMLLHHVTIEGDVIFSKCPCLGSLTIRNCDFGHQSNLLFDTPKLKHLVIECLNYLGVDDKGYDIKLNAPNLISFHCKDYMWNRYSVDENLSALVKVDIDFQRRQVDGNGNQNIYKEKLNHFNQWMVKFMGALRNVQVLTSMSFLLKTVGDGVISSLKDIQFCNLRCLKLAAGLTMHSVKSIRYLLSVSPNIETLSLEIKEVRSTKPWYQYLDEVAIIDQAKLETSLNSDVKFQNMWCQLKFVEIRGVRGCTSEFLFLGLLLKHSKV